jgi:hypothetical protein
MAGAATKRLQAALEDYVASEAGDGRGRTRSAQTSGELVKLAQDLLGGITPKESQDEQSPGRRAASASGKGDPFSGTASRARELMPSATAGSGDE